MKLKITENIEEANLVTHGGTFHPDDVFSTMFLAKYLGEGIVYRTFAVSDDMNKKIVYDIGFGKFDHHGIDAEYRNEKIKYCSFGLLWREYGHDFIEKEHSDCEDKNKLFLAIDEALVMQIDAIDNGNFPLITADYKLLDLDKIIDLFNKAWNEEVDNDDNFYEAVLFAEIIFERLIKREKAKIKALYEVRKLIGTEKDGILIMDKYMPYVDAVLEIIKEGLWDIKIVIFPSNRGGYNIKPMVKEKDSKELVVNFDKNWWGLHDDELAQASGIKTARFIHVNGFLGCTNTLEDAIKLAKSAIENSK